MSTEFKKEDVHERHSAENRKQTRVPSRARYRYRYSLSEKPDKIDSDSESRYR
uniref:Uncharacterized protein n=1 Tax=Candidatus Kentrum sp. FM TaxID=2126340 RepID=A0A450SLA5_9GAMM|nr:MAG: hypothetical protein BECKFM1743C_GA0114222_101395 [Candidatus Kentron sp. FM]VFJ67326.1 MAG: hypothetical protein BECKFM1743A_GA0114220_104442 [Candidatus Kentron sp. FM]VFK11682.1 MAG: hypothetical protein BECKFM1743B_GA0114221_102016 [Candidatus Kentron sp. FM]